MIEAAVGVLVGAAVVVGVLCWAPGRGRLLQAVVDAAIDRREKERMERARVQRPRELFRSGVTGATAVEGEALVEAVAEADRQAEYAGRYAAGLAIRSERSS